MQTRSTRVLMILAAALLVSAGVLVAAVLLVPAERVAALAARHAEVALGREVRLERVSLDFFPAPGIVLEGVAVGRSAPGTNAAAPDDVPPLATIRRVVLRPQLLPLLSRRVIVDAILLERPLLLLEVDSAADLRLPQGDTASAGPARSGTDAVFAVRSFRIEDGRLAYLERATGAAVRLNGLDQELELSGALQAGELVRIEAAGELTIEDVDAVLPTRLATPIRDLRVRLVHDAVLDRARDRLTIDRLALHLGALVLEGAGIVDAVSDSTARRVELRLAAGPVDVAEVVSLARVFRRPATAAASADATGERAGGRARLSDVSGRATIAATVEGELTPGTLPEVHGTLSLDDIAVGPGDAERLVDELRGDIVFSLDSLASDGLAGRLMGEPLGVQFRVHDFAAPVAHASVRTALDLARADALGLLPDSVTARGRVTVDAAMRGPALEPEQVLLDGTIGLAGVTLETPSMLQPVVVSEGRIALQGQQAEAEGIVLRMGESDVTLSLTARDWPPMAFGDSSIVPAVTFDARSRLFDADALLGVDSVTYGSLLFARLAGRPVDGQTAAERAEAAGIALPALPPIALEGRFRADAFRRGGLELQDVDVVVSGGPQALEVRNARLGLMGGTIQLTAQVRPPRAPTAGSAADGAGFPATFQFQIEDVGAAPFFNAFTPFREHLSGSLALTGTVRLVLDQHMLPRRESVIARGTLGLSGGRLQNWSVLRAVGAALGLASFDTLTVRDWVGRFDIAGPRVAISESLLAAGRLDAHVAGTFDFGGRLDLGATVQLSPALAARTGQTALVRLADAATGAEDEIPVGLRITGAVEDPTVELDLSAAKENVTAAARAKAEEEGRRLAERAVREFTEELPVPPSLLPPALRPDTARPDSARPDSARPDTLRADTVTVDSLTLGADSARARLEADLLQRLRGIVRQD